MILQLIMLDNPVVVSDEPINQGDKYLAYDFTLCERYASIPGHGSKKVVAGIPGFPKVDLTSLSYEDVHRITMTDDLVFEIEVDMDFTPGLYSHLDCASCGGDGGYKNTCIECNGHGSTMQIIEEPRVNPKIINDSIKIIKIKEDGK